MAQNDFARFSRKIAQYFWDPLPKNEDASPIWCLGRSYDSRYQESRQSKALGTSPSAQSDSSASQADSAVVTDNNNTKADEEDEALAKSQADLTRSEEEALGWPPEFLDDLESKIWLTYRSSFLPIPRSSDPAAATGMSFATRLRSLGSQSGFTSDTNWGCMIRSGQSLLANAMCMRKLGRDWRHGQSGQEERDLLSLFADTQEAPFSIHRFVEHGAQACGKHPGEWFGPSAAARCLQALTDRYPQANLRVYARPDDSDIYADSLLATATQKDADDNFQPTLIVLGIRLGIDRITPVYHAALKSALEMPQSVGIAGGRPSASHYFIGHQGDQFFYLDPHSTRPMLSPQPSDEDVETCHTRRVRRLDISEMDPSMLIGFLIHSKEEFDEWRKAVSEGEGKQFIHVHDSEPATFAPGSERAGAVDEVETWDETGDEELA
ncbi:Cysteine protease atg4 [Vermiconidia calcicola]|uniref:Cysteine protease atg4 n=1 Tax=Vermiconidia calcicola TaxID=1690605 RepID=A0ACC3MTM9_9PEZI|nr:Cysteine protease atg4 [Vermiconidia calcicola]